MNKFYAKSIQGYCVSALNGENGEKNEEDKKKKISLIIIVIFFIPEIVISSWSKI